MFNYNNLKEYLVSKKIRVKKYKLDSNSFAIAIDKNRMINYVFIYSLEHKIPLERVECVPIDMEAIHKALENLNQSVNINK